MNLREFIKINRGRFVLLVMAGLFMPGLSVLLTYLTQLETDILLKRNFNQFVWISIISLFLLFLAYIGYGIGAYLCNAQAQDLNHQVRSKIVSHFYKDKKVHPVSQVQNRLTNDLELVNKNYYQSLYDLIYGVTLLIAVVLYLILLNWILLIVICLMVAVSLLMPKVTEKPLQKATALISDSNQQYLDTLNDWLSGLGQIRQFLAGGKLFSVSANASKKLEDANVKQTTYVQLLNALNGTVMAIFGVALFIITGFLIKNGQVNIGAIIVIGNFRYYLSNSIEMISDARGQMKGNTELINSVDQDASDIKETVKKKGEEPVSIKTDNLELHFPNGENLTFPDIQIKQGEKILLTGDSGAGKSTLFKLILGQIKPSAGQIIFEDENGKKITPDLSKIGYIPQDPIVFPASIKDNITMFDDKLDDKVEKIVEEVKFDGDINKFKNGLNQEINLDKLNISGGQRQKIVLSRAKVHGSDIILIDEGTSAIDQKATMSILENLVKSKATIVFIAHNFNEGMRQLFDREIHLVKE